MPTRTDEPIPDIRNSRLKSIALTDVLLNIFFVLCVITSVMLFVITFVMRSPQALGGYLALARFPTNYVIGYGKFAAPLVARPRERQKQRREGVPPLARALVSYPWVWLCSSLGRT